VCKVYLVLCAQAIVNATVSTKQIKLRLGVNLQKPLTQARMPKEKIMSILNKLNQAGYAAKKATITTQESRPASETQQQWYLTLCAQKGTSPLEGWELFDSKSLSQEIDRVKAIPIFIQASERQITFINEMTADLGIDPVVAEGLSVTRASEMIATLQKLHQKVMADKPSKKQLELLTQMLYCPDVDESELTGIPQSLIDDFIHSKEELVALYALEEAELQKLIKAKAGSAKVSKTKESFASKIEKEIANQLSLRAQIEKYEEDFSLDSLKKTLVSEFIAKYNAPYREWLRTRASEPQRELINSLLEKNGQEALPYPALIQYDREQASKLIETLRTGKVVNFYEREQPEIKRGASNASEASDMYEEAYEGLIHRLCAMANMSPDDAKMILIQGAEEQESSLQEVALMAAFMNSEDAVITALESVFDEEAIAKILLV
jgi:hypothetical protein